MRVCLPITLWSFLIALFLFSSGNMLLLAQDTEPETDTPKIEETVENNDAVAKDNEDNTEKADETADETPQTDENVSSVSEDAESEEAIPEKEDSDKDVNAKKPVPAKKTPKPVVKNKNSVSTLKLLDIDDVDFTSKRVPDYVPKKKQQLVADIEDPDLQSDGGISTKTESDKSEPEINETDNSNQQQGPTKFEELLFSLGSNTKNWVGWGSLALLLGIMIFLYRMSNHRKKRRVFRKIPSKRR